MYVGSQTIRSQSTSASSCHGVSTGIPAGAGPLTLRRHPLGGRIARQGLIIQPAATAYGDLMMRRRYKNQIVVARVYKVRTQPIWHASVFLDRLVDGNWREIPIEPGLYGQEFASEGDALVAALDLGRRYVDGLQDPHQFEPTRSAPHAAAL
jgi:hypothetical protein